MLSPRDYESIPVLSIVKGVEICVGCGGNYRGVCWRIGQVLNNIRLMHKERAPKADKSFLGNRILKRKVDYAHKSSATPEIYPSEHFLVSSYKHYHCSNVTALAR